MRIKEAAEASSLTEKAIRLYEEKGLICPAITEINGRKFRDYDEATVALLKTIAGLRRSFFSIEQIAAMQESPDRIPEIFTEYRNELKEQYDRLGMLIGRADEILSQMPETDPVENSADLPTVTPAALRDVDTLSEAMTAVTPVVVSEEIPPSAPPKGKREKAELHFRRWDEEIATDEREIVYQRYLEYYSRWEKRYAAELVVKKVFGWIGQFRKIFITLLLLCIAGLAVYHTGIYTDYNKPLDGYLLVYDHNSPRLPPVDSKPIRTEPVSLRLKGEICRYLFKRGYFQGQIYSETYRPYHERSDTYFNWAGLASMRFRLYSPVEDYPFDYYYDNILFTLRADNGSVLDRVYTVPEKDVYCFEVYGLTDPETGNALTGFLVLPARSPEEAEAWLDTVLHPAWQEKHDYNNPHMRH